VLSFFFFQAADGIRDFHVTGVQTCALPIFLLSLSGSAARAAAYSSVDGGGAESTARRTGDQDQGRRRAFGDGGEGGIRTPGPGRSEERRVGKAWRARRGTRRGGGTRRASDQ